MEIPEIVREAFLVAKRSRRLAHAPYSKFKVGAGLVTDHGEIIGGCNIENASYGGTVCAERVAIMKAVSEGRTRFKEIVVVTDAKDPAFPCAFCLQVMAEFFTPETRIWVADSKRIRFENRFVDLLPKPFGPKQLKAAR
jgi:cytidine deaminase